MSHVGLLCPVPPAGQIRKGARLHVILPLPFTNTDTPQQLRAWWRIMIKPTEHWRAHREGGVVGRVELKRRKGSNTGVEKNRFIVVTFF